MPLSTAILALARCAWHTVVLLAHRRLKQPRAQVGRRITFADGSCGSVYRETAIVRPAPTGPVVLVVGFRLRHVRSEWAHRMFRLESELNTLLFAGFPGLVSKLWLRHDQSGLYRGIYQWDDAALAVAYVRALWWVLALVSERESIHYVVLPGLLRDRALERPSIIDRPDGPVGGWWRPVSTSTVPEDPGGFLANFFHFPCRSVYGKRRIAVRGPR